MVKKVGNYITGDLYRLDSYTIDWFSVRLHPGMFYRRMDQFSDTLDKVKGLYTEVDLGDYILIRFSDKEDLSAFYKQHHHYV